MAARVPNTDGSDAIGEILVTQQSYSDAAVVLGPAEPFVDHRFAGLAEFRGRLVPGTENRERVRFHALERDTKTHLVVDAGQVLTRDRRRLGRQEHMDAETAALLDQGLEDRRRVAADRVVGSHEDLELVDEEDQSLQRPTPAAIVGEFLHAGGGEQRSAAAHLLLQVQQNTQRELALGLERNRPSMRQ